MAMLALFGFTVRQILGQRKLWVAAALLLLPAAILVLIRAAGADETPEECWETYHVLMQLLIAVLVPLVCLLYGNALIGAEIEQRTLVYLVTRRLHRATVLLVRYAATWVALAMLCALAVLVLHVFATAGTGAADMPRSQIWPSWPDLRTYVLAVIAGVAGYLAVFMTISLIFSRSLIISVVYYILFELVVSNLPLAASALSISHHLQQTVVHGIPETRRLERWPKETMDQLFPPGETGLDTLAGAVVVLLALASALVTFRELVPARVSRD